MALRIAEVPVSRSTSTVLPWRERAREKLMANVVLPTPPFPDEIGMMRLMATVRQQFIAGGGGVLSEGRRRASRQKAEGRGQKGEAHSSATLHCLSSCLP